MVQILNSDWSRKFLLRSDWLELIGATITTQRHALTLRIYPVKGLQVLAAATFLQEKRLW